MPVASLQLGDHVLSVGTEFAGNRPLAGVQYWQHDVQDDEDQRHVLSAAFDDSASFIAAAQKEWDAVWDKAHVT